MHIVFKERRLFVHTERQHLTHAADSSHLTANTKDKTHAHLTANTYRNVGLFSQIEWKIVW